MDDLNLTIEDKLSVTDDKGRTLIQVGLLLTLYFENAHLPQIREAIADCFDDYEKMCGKYLQWAKHPGKKKFYSIESKKSPNPREWFKNIDENDSWELHYKGGKDYNEASHFTFKGVGVGAWKPRLSYIRVNFPMAWFTDNPSSFPEVTLRICQKLHPVSGYGGLGLIESPNISIINEHEKTSRMIAKRFPGLELDIPMIHVLYLKNGIKGVNWLTVVGDKFLNGLGGMAAVQAKLDDSFIFSSYPGGVLIQAGPRPQMGDSEKDRYPQHYVHLNSILKSIRTKEHRSFHGMDTAEANKWLGRFDR